MLDITQIVANIGTSSEPEYFHMADFDTPDGYTEDKDFGPYVYGDPNIRIKYFLANDKNATVKSIYVAGVANCSAQAMVERLLSYSYFIDTDGPIADSTTTSGIYQNRISVDGIFL